jgi:hypothetical protein
MHNCGKQTRTEAIKKERSGLEQTQKKKLKCPEEIQKVLQLRI